MDKPSFLKNHMDTIAIIGVNIAIAAILVTMWVSNMHRVDASNARIDTANARSDALHVHLTNLIMELRK
jgi:hypothetical protein